MRIRIAMERLRMDQQQLADAVGVSRSAVNNWINDRAHPRNRLGAVEHVLGVDLRSPVSDDLYWLPEDLQPHRDDPRVIEIANMKEITAASKIAVMRYMLDEDEAGEAGEVNRGRSG